MYSSGHSNPNVVHLQAFHNIIRITKRELMREWARSAAGHEYITPLVKEAIPAR